MINGYRKAEKVRFVMTVCAFVTALVLLISYLTCFTVAKYRGGMQGYTNFEISSFHTVLLGNMTRQEVERSWAGEREIVLFGEDVSIDILQPGVCNEEIPFALANGTSPENISGMDFEYVLRLRTTNNIPLKYTLRWTQADGQVKEFRTTEEYYLEDPLPGDAPRYIYPFYEVLHAGTPQETLAAEEYIFSMAGGMFHLESFNLIITWPILPAAEDRPATNDVAYMKEVDIVDMIANVSSQNRSKTYVSSDRTDHVYRGEGIIVAYPSAPADAWSHGEANKFVHLFDYRGFIEFPDDGIDWELSSTAIDPELSSTAIDTELTHSYILNVTNGNNLFKNGALLADHDKLYTDFRIRFAVPMTPDTVYNGDMETERQYRLYLEGPEEGEIAVLSTATEYRKYNLYDDTYEVLPNRAAALAAMEENPTPTAGAFDYTESQYRVYAVYTVLPLPQPPVAEGDPEPSEETERTFRLNNKTEDGSKARYSCLRFRLATTGGLPVGTHTPGITALENRLFAEVFVTYTDD